MQVTNVGGEAHDAGPMRDTTPQEDTVADTHIPKDLDEAKETARELVDEVSDQLADAGELSAERLEEARALLAERLVEARDLLADRARTHGPEFAAWARNTSAELVDRAGPVLAERAEQARSEVARRWHDLEEELPVEVDVEKVGLQVERGVWQAASALLSILLLLPKLLVRALGSLGTLADDVADRGVIAGERAREVAGTVPPSRRDRRRSAVRTAAWTGAGFGFGLVVGWVLGKRETTTVTYEPADIGAHLSPTADPYPVPPGPTADPAKASGVGSSKADEAPAAVDAHPVPPGPAADLPDDGTEDGTDPVTDEGEDVAEDDEDRG